MVYGMSWRCGVAVFRTQCVVDVRKLVRCVRGSVMLERVRHVQCCLLRDESAVVFILRR